MGSPLGHLTCYRCPKTCILRGYIIYKVVMLTGLRCECKCEWLFVLYVSPAMNLTRVGFASKKGSSPPFPTQLRANECVLYSYVCNSGNLLHLLQENEKKENKRPNEGAEI